MPRRRLPPGSWGDIRTRKLGPGVHEARAMYRDYNGRTSHPSARGRSKTDAINNLRENLTKRSEAGARGIVLTRDDLFAKTMELWEEDIEHQIANNVLARSSARTYRSIAKNQIKPRLSQLCNHEVKPPVANDLVKAARDAHGLATAKLVKNVGDQMCQIAVLHEAMDLNPFRSIQRLKEEKTGGLKAIKWMKTEDIHAMWEGLDEYATKKKRDSKGRRVGRKALPWQDLRELSAAMLATGVRIGEVVAITGSCITMDEDGHVYVAIKGHIVRETGRGIVYYDGRKHDKPAVTTRVPQWSNAMWLRRKLAAGDGPIFPALSGGWVDPSNTNRRLKEALEASGYDWVTSHVWRKTVTKLLVDAGLTLQQVADLLGNTVKVLEEHYRPRAELITAGAEALQVIKMSKAE
jgi:integrase